jgi:GNAT superfamily N-acetyltransferase
MQKIYILKNKEVGEQNFYTTISALCEAYPRDSIKVSESTLRRFNFNNENYENDLCIIECAFIKKKSDVLKEKEQQNKANAAQFIWISNILEHPKYCAKIFGTRGIANELGGAIYNDNCDEWLLCVKQDELLGFSGYDKSGENFTFKRAYVFKEYRRLGIYREMFKRRYERAKELGCKILQAKTTVMSRQLFIDNGFFALTNLPKKYVVYRKFL